MLIFFTYKIIKYNFLISTFFAFCLCFVITVQAMPGDLDTSFGNGGKVVTDINNQRNLAYAVAIQTDGKILVGGDVTGDFAVVRYNTNGSLDASFGVNGIVVTNVTGNSETVFSLAIQSDGKIVALGDDNAPGSRSFVLVRYNTNGTLDDTFGMGGKVTISFGTAFHSGNKLLIQSDGKIVAVGRAPNSSNQLNFAAARLNSNGTLDSTFGEGGKTNIGFGCSSTGNARSAVLQPDGKIILAGYTNCSGTLDFAAVRLNINGSIDPGFGIDGKVTTDISASDFGNDVALQADGKIVVAGSSNSNNSFTVVRYNQNGVLDNTFGIAGKMTSVVGNSGNEAYSVKIQQNGKIIVAGTSGAVPDRDFTIIRYNTNGSVDSTFGTNGIVVTQIGSNTLDSGQAIALQDDGKIIFAGFSGIFNSNNPELTPYDFAIVRYLNDSFAPTNKSLFDFDGDGKADVSVFRPDNGVWYLLNSTSGFTGLAFGFGTDKIVPADYDGDGKTDVAVFRSGTWYLQRSRGGFTGVAFGDANDIPVPADYDGDGKADIAVFRPSNGTWYLLRSSLGFTGIAFGQTGDKPVAADYDGDGKADVAVVRRGSGVSIWYILGSMRGFYGLQFGTDTDKPVPADYDGDTKADVAVYRNGFWYILGSTQGFYGLQFGNASDIPAAADYDGDGKTDIAVYRDGIWYLLRSQQGFGAVQFGVANDKPIPAAFVP